MSFIKRSQIEITNLDWLVDLSRDLYDDDSWSVEKVDTCLTTLSKMTDVQVYDGFLEVFVPFENIAELHPMRDAITFVRKTLEDYANPLQEQFWQIEKQISVYGAAKRKELSELKFRQLLQEAGCDQWIRRFTFYDDHPACWKLFEHN